MRNRYFRAIAVLHMMVMIAIAPTTPGSAQTEGDVLRFRADVLTAFQAARPDLNFRVDPRNPAGILSDTIFIDVTNIFNEARAFPAEPQDTLIADFVTGIFAMTDQPDKVELEELVTVLRSGAYIDYLENSGTPFISRRVAGDLHAVVMRNTPRAFRTIGQDLFPDKGKEALVDIGITNTAAFLFTLKNEAYDDFTLYYLDGDHNLTSTLPLVPAFQEILQKRFAEGFVFIVPRRDQLFVFDTRQADVLTKAIAMIEVTFADQYNLLSPEIYTFEGGRIVTVWTPQQGVLPRL